MKFVTLPRTLGRRALALNSTRALSTMSAALRHGSFCSCSNCSRMFLVRNKRNFGFGSFFSSASNPPKGEEEAAAATTNTTTQSSPDANAQESKEFIEMKKSLLEKEEKIKTLTEAYRLSLADMENLRMQTKKEVQGAKDFSIQKFAKDLLDVADVLDMAIASVPEEHRHDASNPHLRDLFSGLNVTRAEMTTIFRRHGIEMFDPVDQPFDPNFHNALFQVPLADKAEGTVVIVQKKGFTLNGRVIRPASVGVSRKP